ncbi:MAG TPA: hypothetical protein VGM72_00660, partial [Micropepsaceae bacterium]
MRRTLVVVTLLSFLTGCTLLRPNTMPAAPKQNLFVVFFVPGTSQLAREAEQIVRQAAGAALQSKMSKIEIAVPRDTPGGVPLVEERVTAIQNILSASHVEQKFLAPTVLLETAQIPAAVDRAEL